MTNTHSNLPRPIIADDDPLIRDALRRSLANEFDAQAENRIQATNLARATPAMPQLALVDLGLPPTPHRPGEGFRLIAELLAHSPHIKILVLSGQDEKANARHARAPDAIDFIAKPCPPGKIEAPLCNALPIQRTALYSRMETLQKHKTDNTTGEMH